MIELQTRLEPSANIEVAQVVVDDILALDLSFLRTISPYVAAAVTAVVPLACHHSWVS